MFIDCSLKTTGLCRFRLENQCFFIDLSLNTIGCHSIFTCTDQKTFFSFILIFHCKHIGARTEPGKGIIDPQSLIRQASLRMPAWAPETIFLSEFYWEQIGRFGGCFKGVVWVREIKRTKGKSWT